MNVERINEIACWVCFIAVVVLFAGQVVLEW